MQVIPAIDIFNRKVVRLEKGDFSKSKVYYDSPLDAAKDLKARGALYLHIVNLKGAQGEREDITDDLRAIKALGVSFQIGGGVRSLQDISRYIDSGAERVIIGTKAIESPVFLKAAISEFGAERIAVAVDSRDGYVYGSGWVHGAVSKEINTFVDELVDAGVETIIVTDIKSDGTLSGVDWRFFEGILKNAAPMRIIASGGVSSIDDVESAVRYAQRYPNLWGLIIGKAFYEGLVSIEEALNIAGKTNNPMP